ncbi:DUF2911 domain-containing protein [Aurantibacter crassamenti]|uniref:DUF2911 domain-containing protein n=1 Tax=Aurantibacter crassamenti TaxID=1837375 RepID=UPI00193A49BE|nr:DUF2911 domain-containing protein [Aurantibacter crassamenti]MBM1106456.1 DUF2911 domain-containing protein [Aurantibacter crassamenti]
MKIFKWLAALVVVILLVLFVGMPYMQQQTKKHSPEKISSFQQNGLDLEVKYSSPSKKGRVIFGELVPYDLVWRTGANEPTTFTTKTDIKIIDKKLNAGTYSLWTIPGEQSWKVMFNEEIPDWGVTVLSGGKETTRDEAADFIRVEIPVKKLSEPVENFTIDFENSKQLNLILSWDDTQIVVPINK